LPVRFEQRPDPVEDKGWLSPRCLGKTGDRPMNLNDIVRTESVPQCIEILCRMRKRKRLLFVQTAFNIPHQNRGGRAPRRQKFSGPRECHTGTPCLMSFESVSLLVCPNVPQGNGPVRVADGKNLAVRR